MKCKPWLFGNTTIRNPLRMHDVLKVIKDNPGETPKKGKIYENRFAYFLAKKNIVEIMRADSNASDLGRKWRSGLVKLGFLYGENSSEPFAITPAGIRLAESESVAARQECFLRSLAAIQLPSSIEKYYKFKTFMPFCYFTSIVLLLLKETGSTKLNFTEMATIVQFSNPHDIAPEKVVERILKFRAKRDKAKNKRTFDVNYSMDAAKAYGYVKGTLGDYADTNFRYLKATGLFCSFGRGIGVVEHRLRTAEIIADMQKICSDEKEYVELLAHGARLPTDDIETALEEWQALTRELEKLGIKIDKQITQDSSVIDVRAACHEANELLFRRRESAYAEEQKNKWSEIAQYMDVLLAGKSRRQKSEDGDVETVSIPSAERPAYFEWILWRSFLAINNMISQPFDARRFQVDVDFMPIGTAPCNGPDMFFEFDDYVLVVEVTLTDSSRQEACEGEPVRRHVADIAKVYNKKQVYCLFVAVNIDTNTAETFRMGIWYDANDVESRLNVVPVKLEDFRTFFKLCFTKGSAKPQTVQRFLDKCILKRNCLYAPGWKRYIGDMAIKDFWVK